MKFKRPAIALALAGLCGGVVLVASPAWAASTSLTTATASGSKFTFSCSTDTAGRLVARSWVDPSDSTTSTVQDTSAVVAAGGKVTQTRDGVENTGYSYRCLLFDSTTGTLITRTPTALHVVTGWNTRFGSNANGDFRSAYDPIKAQRVFNGTPEPWGVGALADRISTVVSFKLSPQEVLTGKYDTMLRSWFSSMPTDRRIDWSFVHEPEDQVYKDKAFTAAQYRAAFIRIQKISKEPGVVKPNVYADLILMSFTLADPTRNWVDFYPDDDADLTNGSPYVDVLAWDLYWGTSDDNQLPAEDLFERFGPGSKRDIFAVNRLTGDPIAIPEIGYDYDPNRASILTEIEQMFRGKAVYVCYFDEDKPVSTTGDHAMSDSASRTEWKRVVAV